MFKDFLKIVEYGGIPLIFILLLLEGNPILGSFIPGAIILIVTGFLVSSTHIFNEYLVIIISIIGAFIGDLIGFYIGLKFNNSKLFKFDKVSSKILDSSKSFFNKFGYLSIILGRQFNLTRAFMPFVAGISEYDKKKFIFVSFISNIIFVFLYFYLGYFFGLLVIQKISHLFKFLTFLGIYFVFVYFFIKLFDNKFTYSENYKLTFRKKLPYLNFFILGFEFLFLFVLLIIKFFKYDYVSSFLFNILYNFFYWFKLSFLFQYLFYIKELVIFLIGFNLFLLILLKRYKCFIVYIWSLLLSSFFIIILKLLLFKFFNVVLFSSVVLLTINLFFAVVYLKEFNFTKKMKYGFFYVDIVLIILLFLYILVLVVYTKHTLNILISFIISTIIVELLLILSHFKVLPIYIYKNIHNKVSHKINFKK